MTDHGPTDERLTDQGIPGQGIPDEGDTEENTVTWGALLAESIARLSQAGVPDPETSGRRIIEEASGFEGAELFPGLTRLATVRGVARLDTMIARRMAGEPLQYVLGRWGFRHLDLMVDRRVLIPRPETEVVAERALVEVRRWGRSRPVVVDLGTGSGAIGLSITLEHHDAEVWLTDVSEPALDVARANLAGLGRHGSRVRVASGSWFSALPVDLAGQVAVVVSNPPYVAPTDDLPAEVADWEPREALVAGNDGYGAYEVLIGEAPRWLAHGGALVLESAPHQTSHLADMASAEFATVEVFDDMAGRNRGIIARL